MGGKELEERETYEGGEQKREEQMRPPWDVTLVRLFPTPSPSPLLLIFFLSFFSQRSLARSVAELLLRRPRLRTRHRFRRIRHCELRQCQDQLCTRVRPLPSPLPLPHSLPFPRCSSLTPRSRRHAQYRNRRLVRNLGLHPLLPPLDLGPNLQKTPLHPLPFLAPPPPPPQQPSLRREPV